MFAPGETVTHRFVIPFAKSDIDYVVVSYRQNGQIILEKNIASSDPDMETDSQLSVSIEYELTQEESLLFEDLTPYSIQLNVFTQGGSRHTSKEIGDKNFIQYHRTKMKSEEVNANE